MQVLAPVSYTHLDVYKRQAIAAWQLFAGQIAFFDGLMVLMLSFGFFGSVRQLMNATHSALALSLIHI